MPSLAPREPVAEVTAIRRSALGFALYAGAFGMTFGAVASALGLTVLQTMVLSVVMFTGASQFAFVGVVGAGGSPFAAILPAMLLGVRNAFYGVPITAIVKPKGWRRWLTAHFVIDETTAMAVAQPDQASRRYAFWLTGVSLFVLWVAGSLAGALLGAAVDPHVLGLDAAAPAVFIALLWSQFKLRGAPALAAVAAVTAALLIPVVPAGVPVIAAGVVAITFGLVAKPAAVQTAEIGADGSEHGASGRDHPGGDDAYGDDAGRDDAHGQGPP